MYQTNLREIDAGMDLEEVAAWIRDYGADAWLISVGGIQAQYPTSLSHQSRNTYLSQRKSGDLIGEAPPAAPKHGLRLLGQMDLSKISPEVAKLHPE